MAAKADCCPPGALPGYINAAKPKGEKSIGVDFYRAVKSVLREFCCDISNIRFIALSDNCGTQYETRPLFFLLCVIVSPQYPGESTWQQSYHSGFRCLGMELWPGKMIPSACIQPNVSITSTCTRQVRVLADHFAECGYYCVVPKLLNEPAFEGGTDGFVIAFKLHTRTRHAKICIPGHARYM